MQLAQSKLTTKRSPKGGLKQEHFRSWIRQLWYFSLNRCTTRHVWGVNTVLVFVCPSPYYFYNKDAQKCWSLLFKRSRTILCTGFAEILSWVQKLIPDTKTELGSEAVYTSFHHVIAYLPLQCHHQTATKSHGSSQWWYNVHDLDHCQKKRIEDLLLLCYKGRTTGLLGDFSYYWQS